MPRLINAQEKGVCVIAATPFRDDGAIDHASIDTLVEFYIETGVDGMTVLGMMGEANKLSEEESKTVMKRFVDRVAGRVPVVVGVSNPGTDALLRFSAEAMDAGASGVMIAPLPSLKNEDHVFKYYATIAERLGTAVPIVLQDYPFVTTVNLSVETINRLVDALPQMVMLKHEDWPGHDKLTRLRKGSSEGRHRRISILVGNGGLYLPQELARGADGAMTGFAYPEMLVQVTRLFAAGEGTTGEDIFDAYLPLLRHEAQPGIGLALRKEALRRRGAIASAFVRAPGARLSREDHDELSRLVERLERRLGASKRPAAKTG
ncbi:dihydrodipicolinate synthase family protein [Mesorhizobium sp. M7D.F.Ca.US.004.03.1.1]|uniref:dihydrodipicolinate synthase family protein n=1 Tax=Mesorhizobium sp. M7D.F.Ca.US.004.03.1.1 TaxID=2496702 RepID=UPI000FCADDC0|nr:dihydrodipicolinate synthase family protein [Mesorhizobium sp. M7D.F.Ca.US.004.03.1.1]RVA23919.1 dihydrodipicolinate synthase family protein [Mesorhizobium sp. M7D.F.Ca.US.004.03.1.1]